MSNIDRATLPNSGVSRRPVEATRNAPGPRSGGGAGGSGTRPAARGKSRRSLARTRAPKLPSVSWRQASPSWWRSEPRRRRRPAIACSGRSRTTPATRNVCPATLEALPERRLAAEEAVPRRLVDDRDEVRVPVVLGRQRTAFQNSKSRMVQKRASVRLRKDFTFRPAT